MNPSGKNANGPRTRPTGETAAGDSRRRKSLSMHEGKAVWCDCCSCEAEERWAEVGREMGIDLSDEEPDDTRSR